MSIGHVLQLLARDGVMLALEGEDGLRVHGSKQAMTPSLRGMLQTHKPALLQWLRDARQDELPPCAPDPVALYEPFPLSDLQLGFYMADDPFMEFHVRPHYYNEKDLPELDVTRYEAAWNRTLHRHRASIVVVRDDGLLQTVRNPAPLTLHVNDWRHLDEPAAEEQLLSLRRQMQRSELPLNHWPWMDVQVSLWRAGGRDRVRLHFNFNNFFSDGLGTTQLMKEVEQHYADPTAVLPDLRLGFRDAAMALERIAEGSIGQTARRYWEERLPQLPPAPALPLRPAMDRRCRSMLQRREDFLGAAQWAALKRFGQTFGLTPSSVLFAAYAEVIAVWSNSRHYVLSNMMTRRLNIHPEIRTIVGNFASLYPLEIDLRQRRHFADGALRIQEQVMRDARHVHWGGMRVMQALNRLRGAIGEAAIPFVVGSGLFMEGFERSDHSCLETSQVMLDHQFWELPDGRLYHVWDVLEAFFPEHLVDDMWRAYGELLRLLADDAAQWQAESFDLLPAWQRHERRQCDADPAALPPERLNQLLPMAAAARPEASAVRCTSACTYAELAAGASAVAAALRQAGVAAGDRVAIVADKGIEWLQAVHGVLQVAAAYVPIDPGLPDDRCALMLADSGAGVLLTTHRHAGRAWPPGTAQLVVGELAQAEPFGPPQEIDADALAYLIYTSGSTGRPKGVMVGHQALLNTLRDINRRFDIGPDDRLFGVSAIGFDLSVYDALGSADAGACVVYPEPDQAFNPSHWLDVMASSEVTVWNSAPALASLLADAAAARGVSLPALRVVLLSGDWIPLALPGRLRGIAPNARIVSLGGATEASIWSIVHEVGEVDPAWASIPYGHPMVNQTWHVLDEQGRDVPVWTAGELFIGGAGLAQGYWNEPQKTAQAFATHPRTGERLYRTGDIGRYLPGGLIEFLGRRDAQVKIQGHRVELGEIEATLRTHPSVSDAAVVVQRACAQEGGQLAAHVTLRAPAGADEQTLGRHLAQRLPRHMVPALWRFTPVLPLSRNGKVDRAALPHVSAAPPVRAQEGPREPRNPAERRLYALWRQVLGHDDIGIDDDFFALGGQSIEAMRLVGAMKDAFGMRLSLGDLWQHRSIAQQARLVAGADATQGQTLQVLSAQGEGVPLFLVHPAGGQVVCYRHLAERLHRPVYGFEVHMTESAVPSHTTVQDMAARYRRLLTQRLPHGPVLLGGWSSGAPIAFEVAAQLRREGRQVSGLILIDSPAPAELPPLQAKWLFDWFAEDLGLPQEAVRVASTLEATGTDPLMPLKVLQDALAAQDLTLPLPAWQLAQVYNTFDAVVRATRVYRPAAIDVHLFVLRAGEGAVSEFLCHPHRGEQDWGWSRHTVAACSSRTLAGTHHTLLMPPLAAACAEAIEGWAASLP